MPALPAPAGDHNILHISRSLSSKLPSLDPRTSSLHTSAAITSLSNLFTRHTSILRRQSGILGIPTTYAGLNSGPAPGVVAGIVLGSVGGLLLILWFVYTVLRLSGYFGTTTVIEEEIIRRHSRSPRRRRSRSQSVSETIEIRTERRGTARRSQEEIIVEEEHGPDEEDDIVEVIEEHSPERRPSRKESKRMSGFRTVDPAEFGGGDRPIRKVSRR